MEDVYGTSPNSQLRRRHAAGANCPRTAHAPYGWSFDAIESELSISERTLLRYLRTCREEFLDDGGRPLLEEFRRGPRRMLRLAAPSAVPEATAYQIVFLYFALSVIQFLDGTVVKDGVEGLWERFQTALPHSQRIRLADFPKKFYALPYAEKDYTAFDDALDLIVRCLIDQHRMRIDYAGLSGDGKVHEVDPYTLAMYKGGLYLIGYTHHVRQITTLAVERIRAAVKLPDTFIYPPHYSPEKFTEGTFGIISGSQTYVELLILNSETAAYLTSRRLHPTQQFRNRRDGKTVLSMTVHGTAELTNWILGLGPYVEVLRPRRLREEVAGLLRSAAALYSER